MVRDFIKTIIFLTVLVCSLFPLFSIGDNKDLSPIYPSDSVLGLLCSPYSSTEHTFLFEALKKDYDYQWVEMYIAQDVKKALVFEYDKVFSKFLPVNNVYFSKSLSNGNGTYSIGARLFNDKGESIVLSFVVSEQPHKIISINTVQSEN
ncbi:MAG: hypothetical protein HUK24_01215 [Sphaerochaetaceae bacterium]|nr:hypothetical protein [Sphaerochaetaceae bacterium]